MTQPRGRVHLSFGMRRGGRVERDEEAAYRREKHFLPKQLIVRPGSLKCGDCLVQSPNEKPVACIGNVAFAASQPASFRRVHVVPTTQLFEGRGVIPTNELDGVLERCKVDMSFVQSLHVAGKCGREVWLELSRALRFQSGIEHFASGRMAMASVARISSALRTLSRFSAFGSG